MINPLQLRSPVDLFRAVGIEPPSVGISAILKASYAQPLSNEERAIWPKLSTMKVPTAPILTLVNAMGRGGGKTETLGQDCTYQTLNPAHDAYALAGSRIYAVIIAPDQKQARDVLLVILSKLEAVAPLGVEMDARDINGVPEVVVRAPWLKTERCITVLTADASTVRGRAVFFLGIDEAGFFPQSPNANTLADIWNAITPRMAQFPGARRVLCSTLGPPSGLYFEMVEKSPKDTLVIRCPTFITSPTPAMRSEAACRRGTPDQATYEREILSKRWGFAGDVWIPSHHVQAAVRPASEFAPRPGGHYIGAIDFAPKGDRTVIGIASAHSKELPNGTIRRVVIERMVSLQGSRETPVLVRDVVAVVRGLVKEFGRVNRFAFDGHTAPELERALQEHNIKTELASTSPSAQTSRWIAMRDGFASGRIVIPDEPKELAREIASLSATMLSGSHAGLLRVDARHDDHADVAALLFERATKLPDTGGDVETHIDGYHWDAESRTVTVRQSFSKPTPNGGRTMSDPPYGTRLFVQWMRDMLRGGMSTASIERWCAENGDPWDPRHD